MTNHPETGIHAYNFYLTGGNEKILKVMQR